MQTTRADQEIQPRIMKTQPELNNTPARFKALARLTPKAALLALALAGLPNTSQADTSWTGANSTAWTDSGNWNNGLPGPGNGVIFINNISVNTPTLTTSVSAGWDIYIGQNGNTGALNQNAGTLATGSGNWAFIGVDAGSVGTYNLPGPASFSASRINLGCWWNNTSHSSGTININTTGTVDAYGTVGDWWQNDSWHVGVDPGNTGTINLTNGTVHSYANMWLGAFSGSGTFNQYGGTNNVVGNLAIARYWNGSIGVSTGRYNISGGTLNAASTSLAYSGGSGDVEDAQLNVSGTGTVNNEGDLVVAVGGNSASVSAVSIATGGTLNVATTTKRWMIVNQYDTVQGTLNVNGGTLNLNANTDLRFSTGNGSGTSAVILNGGTITSWSGNQTGAGSGVLDLNQAGGSSANNTFSLNGGTLTIAQVTANQASGTRVFNFNGGTLKPTGNNANFMQGLSAANVQANGAIIDTTGNNITIAQNLADGGGGGGLTKLGNGTLTLLGNVGYTGPTRVLGGTLSLNSATGLPSPGGDLVVSNATLTLDASGGTAMSANNVSVGSTLNLSLNPTANAISAAGNLTLGDNTTINLAYGTVTANPSAAAINASGSLTKGTNIVINISATGLGTSPVIPLIVVGSGTVNTNGFVLGTLPSGVKGVLTNSTSTSLDLRITSAGQLLSWHGANAGNTVVLTNWDINASSNWYDTRSEEHTSEL